MAAAPVRHAPARAPLAPRRRSGPTAPRPAPARPEQARGAALLDRLLRGRAWVMLIGALLAGIVFLNVSVLELNQGIAATATHVTALEQSNSQLRAQLAQVDTGESIQRAAAARGFVLPPPGQIGYVHERGEDVQRAAARLDASARGHALGSAGPGAPAGASAGPAAAPVTHTAVAPVTPRYAPVTATHTVVAPVTPAHTSLAPVTPAHTYVPSARGPAVASPLTPRGTPTHTGGR